MRALIVAVTAMLVLCSSAFAADWYPGIVHLHTRFSDGALSPSELAALAKGHGARFMVVTDHYNEIGEATKGLTPFAVFQWTQAGVLASFLPDGPYGFANYHRQVSELTEVGEFVAVPGVEIGARWNPESGNEASSHTLALGEVREADSQVLDEYCEKPGRQQDVINKIRQWGMLPVAAHPAFLKKGTPGDLSFGGRTDYRYDFRPSAELPDVDGNRHEAQYRGLAGIELWNVVSAERNEDDIDFYLRLIREGFTPFVTAGNDFHVGLLADRTTWVYADSLTTEGILKAIAEGRTYAAQHGARLVSMSPMPGEHASAGDATITAKISFAKPTGSPKQFVIYRDGVEAKGSRQGKPAGATSYDYRWTDDQADGREHSYVLRVSEVLVTSPAYARIGTVATPADLLPDRSLWVVGGTVRTKPNDLRLPDGLRSATNISGLYPLGGKWIGWSETLIGDDDGVAKRTGFRFRLGNLEALQTVDLANGPDPFEIGDPDWRLEAVAMSEDGQRVYFHVREPGSGHYSAMYEADVAGEGPVRPAPIGTFVSWGASRDGSLKAMGTWEEFPDAPQGRYRYSSIEVLRRGQTDGEWLWTVREGDAVPAWAETYVRCLAVSPDGTRIAYATSDTGLWLASVGAMPEPAPPMQLPPRQECGGLAWSSDGAMLFVTVRQPGQDPKVVCVPPGTPDAVPVLEQADCFCILP